MHQLLKSRAFDFHFVLPLLTIKDEEMTSCPFKDITPADVVKKWTRYRLVDR
jgi:hypothetical protein